MTEPPKPERSLGSLDRFLSQTQCFAFVVPDQADDGRQRLGIAAEWSGGKCIADTCLRFFYASGAQPLLGSRDVARRAVVLCDDAAVLD